ncbi:MAG TPA: hypothetical protein VFS88_02855 [Micavibrio sp.]|nr:hypothetical protein [Micavibrio sp.]
MNSDKHRPIGVRGNALIYILLALALLAGLTMVLSRGASTGGDDLAADQAELATTRMVAYAGSAKSAVDQMLMSGSQLSDLVLLRPNQVGFDAGSNIHKIYHPAGGGLAYKEPTSDIFVIAAGPPASGWYFTGETNVEWTPSTAADLIFVAYRIHMSVCENINRKITGSANVPALTVMDGLFLPTLDGGWGGTLDTAACAECEGYPSLCVANNAETDYIYYNIIEAQ